MNQELRQKVRERDNHKCRFCEDEENLHTHHIIPRKASGSDKQENLMTVCASCHKRIETTQGKALKRLKEQKIEEEVEKRLEERVEDQIEGRKNIVDKIIESDKPITSTITMYIVKKPLIGTDRPRIIFRGYKKETALKKLEKEDYASIKKTHMRIDLREALEDSQDKIDRKLKLNNI